ncbi:MAG: heparinase II/III family protein [Bacteroidales bacterium]
MKNFIYICYFILFVSFIFPATGQEGISQLDLDEAIDILAKVEFQFPAEALELCESDDGLPGPNDPQFATNASRFMAEHPIPPADRQELNLWNVRNTASRQLKCLAYLATERQDARHEVATLCVMRDKWGPDGQALIFDAGYFGSGHQHEDKLNFVYYAGGRELIGDPSIYSYKPDEFEPYWRGSWGHNTIVIDGLTQHRALVPPEEMPDPDRRFVIDIIGQTDPVRGWFALFAITPSHNIIYRCQQQLPLHFETVIQALPPGEPEIKKVQSRQVISGRSATCAGLTYDDPAEMTCGEVRFHGTALLLRTDEGGSGYTQAFMVDGKQLTIDGELVFSTENPTPARSFDLW